MQKDKVVSIARCPKEEDEELSIENADTMDGIDLNEFNLLDKEEPISEENNSLDVEETMMTKEMNNEKI